MRALIQRVTRAAVVVDGQEVGSIGPGPGIVVLLGVAADDQEADARYLVEKLVNLRIFSGQDGRQDSRFDLSALDVGAELLLVSQFTLYAETRKGRRPSFTQAAAPDDARRLYEYAAESFGRAGLKVATGRFQEHMLVSLENDGPVTLLLDSSDRHKPRR